MSTKWKIQKFTKWEKFYQKIITNLVWKTFIWKTRKKSMSSNWKKFNIKTFVNFMPMWWGMFNQTFQKFSCSPSRKSLTRKLSRITCPGSGKS